MFDSGLQGFLALLARDDVKTILTRATTIIKDLIESKYEASIAEIDELLGQPDEWMPVHGNPSSPPSAAAT